MHLSILSFFSFFIYCTTFIAQKMVVSLTINNHNDKKKKKEYTSKYEITYKEKSTMTRLNIFE